MTQNNTLNVKLSDSQLNKVKVGMKNYQSSFKSFIKYDLWF